VRKTRRLPFVPRWPPYDLRALHSRPLGRYTLGRRVVHRHLHPAEPAAAHTQTDAQAHPTSDADSRSADPEAEADSGSSNSRASDAGATDSLASHTAANTSPYAGRGACMLQH
jgi:hypothetical protein